ncbi:protein-lysine N-methyltransferase CG9154 [Anopheles ziemanni]|uniref:protein-lysine N-methyltransferase CG9154 n=1 Tax=Anopheles coustani TaxID=139045 RepID=UPI0026592BCE|nr:protein-lysine N-methyltransferase CG9154 [Anopheles coustani]XP_058168341.1 protein-lysine N-methyltransferase CG9154 [Anopheles ziemanni]
MEESTGVIGDDECVLPEDTMLILQQFLQEKAMRERSEATETDGCFEENWQLSQFWYNENTKQKLALIVETLRNRQVPLLPESNFKVALLSAPSALKHVQAVHEDVILFEFDERFTKYGERFRKYDYNKAYEPEYMDEFCHQFDLIIADPPFLSQECISKMGTIIKKIAKQDGKVVLCSGAVVQDWAKEHLNLDLCDFRPEHERNLGNEFRSYANFDLDGILDKAK